MPRSIRAVIFDFDGTLADSCQPIAESVNHVRAKHGLGPMEMAEVRRHVGLGPAHLLAHTVPGCDVESAVASYRAHHPSVMLKGTVLLPGAGEAAQALHGAGLALAICSNKPRIFTKRLMEHLGLDGNFQAILGPEDVPRPKPAPDMLLAALTCLEVATKEALYVGDMVVDIEAARAAGVAVWVVASGSDARLALEGAGPDRVLESLEDLPRAVAQLAAR